MVARWQWASLVLGAVVTALVGGLGFAEGRPEWERFQREYHRLAAGTDESGRRAEVLQFEIPALGRVDRCVTCHLGATNPQMAGAPAPFATHSPLIDSHPPEEFGCTVCHGGEGRAVTAAEAHGEVPGQHDRLIPTALRASACYACHGSSSLPPADTAVVAEGVKLINAYKCLRCHQMDGGDRGPRSRGGSIGPDLGTIGTQRNWVELYAHLLSPAAMVPGSTMPDFGLRRREATAITAYLLTRLDATERVANWAYLASEPIAVAPAPVAVTAPASSPLGLDYDGENLFEGLGCSVCHRVGLRGGEVGPALTHIGRARDEAWLRDLLTDPARVVPDGRMPAYDLSESQLGALVKYMGSLR